SGLSDETFESLRAELAKYPLKSEAMSIFIPASHRLTGNDVDFEGALKFAGAALTRCKQVGAEVVVLGSGGARRVPEGFDHDVALGQFTEFCRELGDVADSVGIDIAVEPLNLREDNLINTIEQGARVVDAVAHPRIRLLADLYHMGEDNDSLESVAQAGTRLAHTHVADLGRVAPGYAENGEQDFTGFFRSLRRAGYDARCSFEGSYEDIATQAAPVIALMKQRWNESA
ncbi:MAG TPA: sugar phosphate isomerase/epimerase family protein, partial [Abditibacteriaceae bacterium]